MLVTSYHYARNVGLDYFRNKISVVEARFGEELDASELARLHVLDLLVCDAAHVLQVVDLGSANHSRCHGCTSPRGLRVDPLGRRTNAKRLATAERAKLLYAPRLYRQACR